MSTDEENGAVLDLRRIMAMIGAIYWVLMTVIVVPTVAVFFLSFIVFPFIFIQRVFGNKKAKLGIKMDHFLCRQVNNIWVSAGQYTGLNVTEYGDDISLIAEKRGIILCNHLGLVDHFCLMTALFNKGSLAGRYMWVIFNIWKVTPLGAMWLVHGNFFINGGAARRKSVLNDLREHLLRNYWHYDFGWVIMYPEGSRLFLIRESEKRFAAANGFEPFKNCVHPRVGAAHATLQVCGPSTADETKANGGDFSPMEYLVDVTLGYPNGNVPDLNKALLGEWPNDNTNVAVHFQTHRIKPEWADEETFKEWLYERYEEKDKLLGKFYKTGRFEGPSRTIQFPLWRNILVQLYWLVSFYLCYKLLIRPFAQQLSQLVFSLF